MMSSWHKKQKTKLICHLYKTPLKQIVILKIDLQKGDIKKYLSFLSNTNGIFEQSNRIRKRFLITEMLWLKNEERILELKEHYFLNPHEALRHCSSVICKKQLWMIKKKRQNLIKSSTANSQEVEGWQEHAERHTGMQTAKSRLWETLWDKRLNFFNKLREKERQT